MWIACLFTAAAVFLMLGLWLLVDRWARRAGVPYYEGCAALEKGLEGCLGCAMAKTCGPQDQTTGGKQGPAE